MYRENEELKKRIIDYDIRLTFSFDLGFGIEGPIGSPFKIDASYISPYVKRALSIGKLCKRYNVNIIMTDSFVEKLSEETQTYLRMIDILKEEENTKEVGLFTLDLDCSLIAKECDISITEMISKSEKDNNQSLVKLSKFNKRKRRIKNMKLYKEEPVKNKVWKDFIADDEDFAFMRNSLNKNFFALYNEAFDEFQFGDWNKAKELFEQILDTNDDDGPSQYLYDILEQNNFERPLNWEGNKLIN